MNAGYITPQEAERIIKNYLMREGRELILNILKEYMETTNINFKTEEAEKNIIEEKKFINLSNNKKIELDPEIVRKKEIIKNFIEELKKYDEKDKVEIKVGQLKQFIIKVFNLNEELEYNKKIYLEKIENLKKEEKNLKNDINSLNIEYKSSKIKIEELNRDIEELIDTKENLETNIHQQKKAIESLEENIIKKEKEIKILENKNVEYMRDINNLTKEKQSLEEIILNKKVELDEIKQENNELNRKIGKLNGVEELSRMYECYLKVSNDYRKRLERLIKFEDISSFVACCYNIGAMDDLWDSLNVEVRSGNLADAYILRDIFEYFVIQQNKKYDESLYKLLIPNIGEEFDPTKHMTINGSSSGKIEEVIFPGYGSMESKSDPNQTDEERGFKKIRKLAMVRVR